MKNRTWAILFAAIAVICAVFYFFAPRQTGKAIGIYQNGELIYTINPDTVTEIYEIVLEQDGDVNVIEVSSDGICMKEANCPDGTCVKRGALHEKATPIVCLPNKIVIKYIKASGEVDAVAGVAG